MNISKSIKLALEYYRGGKLQLAEHTLRKILNVQKSSADAHYHLGNILYDTRRIEEAISCYDKALALNPSFAGTHYNLGTIFLEKDNLEKAIYHFQKALQLDPACADICNLLGVAFQKTNQFDKAIMYYKKALQLNPSFFIAYYNLGNISDEKGDPEKALGYYQKTLQFNPDYAGAYSGIGNILQKKGQLDDAINYYKRALEFSSNDARLHYNLGNAYREKGQMDNALACYQRAIDLRSDLIEARWAHCFSQIPISYTDFKSIETSRASYHKELIELYEIISLDKPEDIEAASRVIGNQQPFYLAYQGYNDRDLQQIYGPLVCKIMASRFPKFADRCMLPRHIEGEALRVGIVSGFFFLHSNWKLPIKGWVENIDKRRFNLYGYYTGKIKDEQTTIGAQNFCRFVEDINHFEELCETIRRDRLHVLIYPEIGMDPMTVRLAALRLAPVQCTSWGHPETSGLPTIDYYLSSDLMEPPDASNHYTEKLIRLPNLSVYYTPLNIPQMAASRESFDLRANSILYFCGQSLYKYLPQYDDIFPRIAREVSNCQFLFISDPISAFITEQFRTRLCNIFRKFDMNLNDYVVFLKPLQPYEFYAVNQLSDIFLDTIGWSGCNSTFEAIANNLPILTLLGELMRGRHSSAILTMMGATDTIAKTLDEYIGLAIKLAQDSQWRKLMSEKIAANKHRIYRDKTCIAALENFLEAVIKEKL